MAAASDVPLSSVPNITGAGSWVSVALLLTLPWLSQFHTLSQIVHGCDC